MSFTTTQRRAAKIKNHPVAELVAAVVVAAVSSMILHAQLLITARAASILESTASLCRKSSLIITWSKQTQTCSTPALLLLLSQIIKILDQIRHNT